MERNKIRSRILKLCAVAGISLAGFVPGQMVPFSRQWLLYEGLRTTAAIIVGVMGSWIAVMYPGVVSPIKNVTEREMANGNNEGAESVYRLLWPIGYSTVILATILLLGPAAEVAREIPPLTMYPGLLRGLSFSLLLCLTLMQLWSLGLTLFASELARRELRRRLGPGIRARYFSLAGKIKPGGNDSSQ